MKKTMLFELGSIYVSPDAQAVFESGDLDPQELLRRHVTADWDEASDPEVVRASEKAIQSEGVIVSSWQISGYTVWIRTDSSRKTTIIDLPLEH